MALTSGQLALLVEIRHTGSLARAALALAVTPPAVSQQLARLEKEVGAPLVERGARGARLTRLGEQLAGHGQRVAEELRRADEAAAAFIGAHRNRLRVGAPASVTYRLLPDVLAAIRFRFPAARLSVVDILSDAGPALVADGTLDLALSASYGSLPTVDTVTTHHVLADPMLVVLPAGHPLAAAPARPIDLADLADEAWVSGPPGRPSRTQLDLAAADRGFIPHVPFQTESYDVAQAMTQAGVAISLVPRLALTRPPGTRARPTGLVRDIAAIVPVSHDHVPLADVALAHLAEVARNTEGASA